MAMLTGPGSPVPRGRRIPLSQFWLDWRISLVLLGVCLLVAGAAIIALWGWPEAVPVISGPSPGVHRERAQLYERLGKIEESIQEYQGALTLSPDDPALHKALALLFEKGGRFDEAIASYERYLQLEPESADASAIRVRIAKLRRTGTSFRSDPASHRR
ncbi:MAG: tetratricopeptide repeat protein [Candidatus Methylomirabilales bacterium]